MRLKYIEGLLNKDTESHVYPRRVYIEPTNHCNCRCIHCPSVDYMTREKGFMDWNLYKKIIDELGPLWPYTSVNLFEHGEPLLHPKIFDMIDYAQDQNLFVKMNSNLGALKKKDISKLLRLNYLEVSLDACSSQTYQTIKRTGEGRFNTVLNNLLDYLEMWGELATSESYACDVSFLSQERNFKEIQIFEEMFSRLPIGHVSIYKLHNFTGAISEGSNGIPDQKKIPKEEHPCCNSAWDVLGINWDGKVVACTYDYNRRSVIGDVNTQSVMECWNSDDMKKFRQGQLQRDFSWIERNGPICSVCSIRWIPDYAIPTDFMDEVGKMKKYLVNAVNRVSDQRMRYDDWMKRWNYLKKNRQQWLDELYERTAKLSQKE